MYFGLVHYPQIEHSGFHNFRHRYDPYANLLPVHVTFIHPVPESIGREKLERHIETVIDSWKSFKVHFCLVEKTWDHWLYLGAKEGHSEVVDLHDQLYKGILSPHLREDLPFYPHIGLGLFSKEAYDFDNPTAQLTLDEKRFNKARREFEDLGTDIWCTIDRLTLVKINSSYTECVDLNDFSLPDNT
jgi:hypothetical protein